MDNILIANANQYIGQYVTTAAFGEIDVITSSDSAVIAYNQAVELGHKRPVLIYVPQENE